MSIDYRTIFESISGLYLILDPTFKIAAVSDGYAAATMTEREKIVGHFIFDIFPDNPDDEGATGVTNLRASLDIVTKTLQQHTMALQRYDIRRPDGSWEIRYWRPSNRPIILDGKMVYIVHQAEDVTDIIKYNEGFKLLVEGVKEYAILMLDLKGNITSWNSGAERLFEYKESEILGKNFSTFFTKQDLDAKQPDHELKIAAAEGAYESDSWRVKKDGEKFWCTVVINTLYDDLGRVRAYCKIVKDMTEKRKVALLLTAQANRFYGILEQAHSAVVSMNENRIITFWNKAAEKTFGYTAEEMIGSILDEKIIPLEYLEAHRQGMEKFHKTKDGAVFDKKLTLSAKRKDGEEFPCDLVVTKAREEDGSYIFTAFITDITDRIEKQRIAVLNESLKKLNEELELFAYVTSHDLQDPLRTMNAYIKLLSKKFPNPDAADYLDIIVQSNTKMQNLVANLLQYARDSGQALNIRRTNIQDVVNESISTLETFITENNAKLTVGPMPVIACDAIQIGQVFHNLIHNAVKYRHPKRDPEIKITYEETKKEHVFTVSDNGIGIKNDELSRLFVLYRRIRKDDKGVGFGLAVCKKIMEHHEGRIWADSIVGEGSNFYFAIPKYLAVGGGYL